MNIRKHETLVVRELIITRLCNQPPIGRCNNPEHYSHKTTSPICMECLADQIHDIYVKEGYRLIPKLTVLSDEEKAIVDIVERIWIGGYENHADNVKNHKAGILPLKTKAVFVEEIAQFYHSRIEQVRAEIKRRAAL